MKRAVLSISKLRVESFHMAFFRYLHALLALIFSAASLFAQQPSGTASNSAVSAPSVSAKAALANPLLAAHDRIEIKVFHEPELDTNARISGDGKITFPLIGEVAVAGKTAQAAARLIRDRLEARFLVDPQVTLTVVEPTRRLFTILGQVQRPGTYRFPDRETLNVIQVIGIAGGYTRIADPARITVKRHANGKDTVFQLNAKSMARDQEAKPFEVEPGDMITVSERMF